MTVFPCTYYDSLPAENVFIVNKYLSTYIDFNKNCYRFGVFKLEFADGNF